MKNIHIKQKFIQQISRGEVSSLLLVDDNQAITVNDEVEVINDETNEAIGVLLVNEVLIKQLQDFESQKDSFVRVTTEQDSSPTVAAKRVQFSFKPYQAKRLVEDTVVNKFAELTEVNMYADGGSRGNPGPSASGWVVCDLENTILKENGFYLGITTNNQAEYQALRLGLEDAKKMGAQVVHVYMDSLLVVNQMKGIFKVKNRDLWPIYEAIREHVKTFKKVTFTHVPRELNKEADRMVNETLDAIAAKA